MGFWPPAVLVGDAKRHGVRFHNVDVNRSVERCVIEADGAIRIGLRFVNGLGEQGSASLEAARAAGGPFSDLRDLCRRTRLPRAAVERLILAGALDAFGVPRRDLLWEAGTLRYQADELDLIAPLPPLNLASLTHWEMQRQSEAVLGLTVGDHAFVALRAWLARQGLRSSRALRAGEDGTRVETAGILVACQAPPTAKGHTFLTLEDEHGLIDVVLRPSTAARYRGLLHLNAALRVTGMLQRSDDLVSILAWHIEPLTVPGSLITT